MPLYEFTCTGCKLNTAARVPSLTMCDDCHDATQTCDRCEARVTAGTLLNCGDVSICADCEDDTGWHAAARRRAAHFNSQDQHYAACKEAYVGVAR